MCDKQYKHLNYVFVCAMRIIMYKIKNELFFHNYYTFTNCSSEKFKLCIFKYGRDHEFKLYENQWINNVGYGFC
jgi:hypothetical protein